MIGLKAYGHGNGCSIAADLMPIDQKVVGSNPSFVFCTLFLYLLSVVVYFKQVS